MKLQLFFSNNRVKYCLAMFCSFLFLNNSFTQSQDLGWGMKIGANYSTVKNTRYVSGIEPIFKALGGFYYKQKIGAKGDSSKFLIGFDAMIIRKGYQREIKNSLETVTYKQYFNYSTLPIYLGYQPSNFIQVIGGIELGWLWSSKLHGHPTTAKGYGNFSPLDVGLLAGVVISPTKTFSLDIRAIRGLTNMTRFEYFDAYGNSKGKISAFQNFCLQVSFNFNLENL
jgi:hypothetical protein